MAGAYDRAVAYDEELAARIRDLIVDEPSLTEKKMFGGLAFLIGRFIGTFLMRFYSSANLLAVYAGINILLCVVAIMGHGMITVYTVLGICFFCLSCFLPFLL